MIIIIMFFPAAPAALAGFLIFGWMFFNFEWSDNSVTAYTVDSK